LEIPLQQQQQQQQQQAMVRASHWNNSDYAQTLSSHQSANELREQYDLPVINKQDMQGERDPLLLLPSANIITNLNGLLKEYASDLEEKSVDVVKCCRQNLS
jgi:PHP family Zn ribbon phosphoesterase